MVDTVGAAGYYAARVAEYERIYAKPDRQGDLVRLRDIAAAFGRGRRVLEVACAMAIGLRFLLQRQPRWWLSMSVKKSYQLLVPGNCMSSVWCSTVPTHLHLTACLVTSMRVSQGSGGRMFRGRICRGSWQVCIVS